jgi:CRISPR-associated endonuclease Cas2
MAEFLYVYTYDISDAKVRRRAAKLLTKRSVRVLESVYEARLSPYKAQKLAGAVSQAIGNRGALRVYCIGQSTHRHCQAFGGPLIQGAEGYYLL